jgi:hypothetical protein
MLKNWTVVTQPVRFATDGVMMRERYLQSKNHSNHKHTEQIISLFGCAETSNRIALAGEKFRLNQKLCNRRGGRPLSSYAVEYCLTLPKGYRPTEQQWKSVIRDCSLALVKLCKLNKSEFAQFRQQIRAVLHQQKQDAKRGSGDHVHLVVGKVVATRVLKELQQKKATKLIKQVFNHSVLKHVGIDNRSYVPAEVEKGRRLSTWQYEHRKCQQTLEIEKLIKQLHKQTEKWLKAKSENDQRQLQRQSNRLIKTQQELREKPLSIAQKETVQKILELKVH